MNNKNKILIKTENNLYKQKNKKMCNKMSVNVSTRSQAKEEDLCVSVFCAI